MSTYDLVNDFTSDTFWTRKGTGQNGVESRTLIDFILVSRSIASKVENVRIAEYPDNLSDHCPVEMDLIVHLDISHSYLSCFL